MTIHKAKGLDFGVVILPVFSTGNGDGLHKGDFWVEGETEPWNSYPLFHAKAASGLLQGDFALAYQEDVYKRALENLNNFYVACTRPTTGLILDFTLDVDLEVKGSSSKLSRLPVQLGRFLLEKEEKKEIPFEDYSFEKPEDDTNLFLFSYGRKARVVPEKHGEESKAAQFVETIQFPDAGTIPWAEERTEIFEANVGILVHKILERTWHPGQWEKLLEKESTSQGPEVIAEARAQLQNLFSTPEFGVWFSKEYKMYPEQQLLTSKNKLIRVDRLLFKEGEAILLDYKTGEELEIHQIQMKEYMEALSASIPEKLSGYLIYSHQQIIRKIV